MPPNTRETISGDAELEKRIQLIATAAKERNPNGIHQPIASQIKRAEGDAEMIDIPYGGLDNQAEDQRQQPQLQEASGETEEKQKFTDDETQVMQFSYHAQLPQQQQQHHHQEQQHHMHMQMHSLYQQHNSMHFTSPGWQSLQQYPHQQHIHQHPFEQHQFGQHQEQQQQTNHDVGQALDEQLAFSQVKVEEGAEYLNPISGQRFLLNCTAVNVPQHYLA